MRNFFTLTLILFMLITFSACSLNIIGNSGIRGNGRVISDSQNDHLPKPTGIVYTKIIITHEAGSAAAVEAFGATFQESLGACGYRTGSTDSTNNYTKDHVQPNSRDTLVFKFTQFSTTPSLYYNVVVYNERTKQPYWRGKATQSIIINTSETEMAVRSANKLIRKLQARKVI